MFRNLKNFFRQYANSIAFFISLFSLIPALWGNEYAWITSLSIFVLICLIIGIRLLMAINTLTKYKYPSEFIANSSFYQLSTNDGIIIEYDTYRHIQCKRLISTEYPTHFKWSGSKNPEISSNLQVLGETKFAGSSIDADKALLIFKKPLSYNQTAVVHFKAICDDSDKKSASYLGTKVTQPIDIIHYRIILGYKPDNYNEPAILSRKSLKAQSWASYEQVATVQFNQKSKSYEHHLIYPELGYHYKLEWTK